MFFINIKIFLLMKTNMGIKTLLKCIHICSTFNCDLVSQHDLCLPTLSPDEAIKFIFSDIAVA